MHGGGGGGGGGGEGGWRIFSFKFKCLKGFSLGSFRKDMGLGFSFGYLKDMFEKIYIKEFKCTRKIKQCLLELIISICKRFLQNKEHLWIGQCFMIRTL